MCVCTLRHGGGNKHAHMLNARGAQISGNTAEMRDSERVCVRNEPVVSCAARAQGYHRGCRVFLDVMSRLKQHACSHSEDVWRQRARDFSCKMLKFQVKKSAFSFRICSRTNTCGSVMRPPPALSLLSGGVNGQTQTGSAMSRCSRSTQTRADVSTAAPPSTSCARPASL